MRQLTSILACLFLAASLRAAPPPNIVYIIADDLGYGDIHALNPERGKIATPNYDKLVSQGVAFTDCHGGSSVCTPTRYGVLTGRYAWRTRLQSGVIDGEDKPLIAEGRLTVPALLKQRGYHTAAIGKWHLGWEFERNGAGGFEKNIAEVGTKITGSPITRGFDEYYGFNHARSMRNLVEQDRVIEHVEPVDMLPKLTQRAVQHITARAKTGRPFFLYFALPSPHTPIVPSAEWRGKSGALGKYGDYVMQTDWAVGQVMAALDQAGLSGNTIVIATSDNGCSPAAGTPQLEMLGHFASAQFRGYKADLWDGGHRIPFIVRWPGVVAPGSRNPSLICLTDLMATVAELTGQALAANAGEDSFSFLSELRGSGHSTRPAIVHHSIAGYFSIRQGPWKLELCRGSGGWAKPGEAEAIQQGLPAVQLYNMHQDIAETRNLQSAQPEKVAQLTALLEKTISSGRSTPGDPQSNDFPIDWKKETAGKSKRKKSK